VDADADGTETDAAGTERCDGVDNDGDTLIDEGWDLLSDQMNCGECGNICHFNNAAASCVDSGVASPSARRTTAASRATVASTASLPEAFSRSSTIVFPVPASIARTETS
jgi:hypothetical protein